MFTYILYLFMIPLLIYLYLDDGFYRKQLPSIGITLYSSNMLLNTLFFIITRNSILNISIADFPYSILYIVGSMLFCSISYHILNVKYKNKLYIYKGLTILSILMCTSAIIYFFWLLCDSGRMSFSMFIYNANTPLNTEAADFNKQISSLLFFIIFMNICIVYGILKCEKFVFIKLKYKKGCNKNKRVIASLLPISNIIITCALPYYAFHFEEAFKYFFYNSPFIENHYVNPMDVQLTWPSKKRNLIYIFVESFESSYFSKDLGGLDNQNLLPNLTELMAKGVTFSDKDKGFGGAVTMPDANITISGMVASLSGVNYKIPQDMKDGDIGKTLPGITTLTDLLKEQGYQEYFMIGSYVNAYSIGPFYRKHGDALTVGLDEKIAMKDLPEGYKVWWGFEDSKLYEFAKNDLTKLANTTDPFMYTIATNDTHRKGGYLDAMCKYNNAYAMQNAIACTDEMLSNFVEWIMTQPFYENTTVVIVGDHLGHEEEYVSSLNQKERRIFNLILNSVNKNTPKTRQFWAGDMFPTVLSAMGVEIEGNHLGLGVDLFSSEQTLVEYYGEEELASYLEENSKFYNEEFLVMKEEE